MFKRIIVILCFSILFAFDNINSQDNFKIFLPKYVPENTRFEVSIITSNKFPEAENLVVYFLPEQTLAITKAEIWIGNGKVELPLTNEFISEYSEQFKKVVVDFSDTSIFRDETFFQIVLSLKPGHTNSNTLKFFGEYVDGEKVISYLLNSDLETDFNNSHLYDISFSYYLKSSTADNALSFN